MSDAPIRYQRPSPGAPEARKLRAGADNTSAMKTVTYTPSLEPALASSLTTALRERGLDVVPARVAPDRGPAGATAALGGALVEWEELLEREAPQALLLAGDDDFVLGAALSAAKLEVPVLRLGPATPDEGSASGSSPASNAQLIGLLASESADPATAASEIAGWLESLPTLPAR